MKYSEFKTEVEKLGYIVKNKNEAHIYVSDADDLTIARVGKLHAVEMATDFMSFTTITRFERKLLIYTHCKNLAETPLAEREEEKKYYLLYDVPPLLRAVHAKPRYLYRRIYDGYIDTSFSQTNDSTFKTIFTESEIEQMDITGFVRVEVTP